MNMLGPQGNSPSVGGPPNLGTPTTVGAAVGSQVGVGGPVAPFGVRPGQSPTTMMARLPEGLSFRPGSILRGQVTGQDPSGGYSLQIGDRTLTTRSTLSLAVGQAVQFRVQGENDGQLMLHLVNSPFTALKTNDLVNNLAAMHIAPSEANLELAQSMVELGVPLTKENITTLLSQTAVRDGATSGPNAGAPPSLQARVAAVVFMEQNQIPVTPQNMLTLSQFMASNPQLGSQMFALSGELRKLARSVDGKAINLLKDLPELMEDGGVGKDLDPKKMDQSKAPPKQLYKMARQVDIETNLTPYGGGEDPWELLAELKRFRAESKGVLDEKDLVAFLKLLGDVEGNVAAQRLINQAHPEQLFGFYYLQFPLFGGGNNVDVWIRYRKEDDGGKTVDSEDSALEFLVTTEHMGDLFFVAETQGKALDVQVGVESEEVRDFVSRYLGVLQDRLEQAYWEPVTTCCELRAPGGGRELVERTDFALVESCDVHAW